jgi:hypothetical protein
MIAFREFSFTLALLCLSTFTPILVAEGFHHHADLKTHDDCSLCNWQQNNSQAPSSPLPPVLFFTFLVFRLFVSQPVFFSYLFISPFGRSPPSASIA